MLSSAETPLEYINQLPEERKKIILKIRKVILDSLPRGFLETMSYGMLAYVVPHSIYPDGYHCKPEEPLPFINLASQKNFIGFYHMALYSNNELLNWFVEEYGKVCKYKLDMGKSCVRLKKPEDIPYNLLGELCSKISVNNWVSQYEKYIKK